MTMPLIQDLKNPAMRDRHWTQLQEEVQKPFDHTSTADIGTCSMSACTVEPNLDTLGAEESVLIIEAS